MASSSSTTLEDFAALNAELAALVRARIPLEPELRRLASQLPTGAGALADRLASRMEGGASLAEAMRAEGDNLPEVYRAVVVAGLDITRASRKELFEFRRHGVSFVFQTFNLFPALTALENAEFGADVAGRPDPTAVAAEMLERVGLGDRLLADEPTGELDFRTGIQILELLHAQAHTGRAVVVVTHNREIARVADRVIELSSGRVVRQGPPEGGRVRIADLRW